MAVRGRLDAMWRRQLARRQQIVQWRPSTEEEILPAVLKASYKVEYGTARRPSVLRIAPDVHSTLAMAGARSSMPLDMSLGRFGPRGANIPDYYDPRPGIVGLVVEVDGYVQRGVWRLCDDAGTLLYDCREGKSP